MTVLKSEIDTRSEAFQRNRDAMQAQVDAVKSLIEKIKLGGGEGDAPVAAAEQMAEALPDLLAAGAAIVGGCCGSTPAHIRLFRRLLDGGKA